MTGEGVLERPGEGYGDTVELDMITSRREMASGRSAPQSVSIEWSRVELDARSLEFLVIISEFVTGNCCYRNVFDG